MALDTEEGNIKEHRDYLKNEEDKRKRARVVRTTIGGPKLRWVSRLEDAKAAILVPEITPPVVNPNPLAYRSVYGPPATLFTPTVYTYSSGFLVKTSIASSSSTLTQGTMPGTTLSQYSPPFPVWPPQTGQQQSYFAASASSIGAPESSTSVTHPASNEQTIFQPLPQLTTARATPSARTVTGQPSAYDQQTSNSATPAEPEYKIETVTKNYVVHELGQQKGTPKPSWLETMQAMFGDHVRWDDVKVYVGKNRPLGKFSDIHFS